MPRSRLTFRQRDLAAALKAAKAAGYPIARIEISKDGIVIIPGTPEHVEGSRDHDFDYDAALERAKAEGRW